MTRAALQLKVDGWSGHLTASGSRYDFPGVDHERRQTASNIAQLVYPRSQMSFDPIGIKTLFTLDPKWISIQRIRDCLLNGVYDF